MNLDNILIYSSCTIEQGAFKGSKIGELKIYANTIEPETFMNRSIDNIIINEKHTSLLLELFIISMRIN